MTELLSVCVFVCVGCRGGGGQRKRLYSAVPGRVFVATRSHSAHGEREISFSKGDKVKGQMIFLIMSFSSSQYIFKKCMKKSYIFVLFSFTQLHSKCQLMLTLNI